MTDRKTEGRGVVISGAYGMGNAGDEAVLAGILAELRRIDPAMPVTVLARDPAGETKRHGVPAVHPFRVLSWYRILRRSALLISGGGTLLQDVTSRRNLLYYLAVIRLAKRAGCAVQLYGCGVGPLGDKRSRTATTRTLNKCADVITLRDRDSLALLEGLGVTEPKCVLAADPALSLPPAAGEKEKAAGFVLRDWPGLRERIPAFADAARYVWEQYRLTPVLLCLAPEDHGPARTLARRLEAENIPCAVSLDPRRISRMSLVLSMRLHGLIFTLRDGIPAAGVSYDPKVTAFCREAVLPCVSLADADAAALRSILDEAALLDGEDLSAAARHLRERERANGRTAAQLLAGAAAYTVNA